LRERRNNETFPGIFSEEWAMTFVGIDTVVYATDDMKLARRFFTDWGLKKTKATPTKTVFETEIGSEVVLYPSNSKHLPPPAAPGLGYRETIWGVSSAKHLKQIADELSRDQELKFDDDGTIHAVDPNGFATGFRVWKHRHSLKFEPTEYNSPAGRPRVNKVGAFHQRGRPLRMGHVAFLVPDIKAAETFYSKRLGFPVSDRYAGGSGVFLRYAKESDHHNLFFIHSKQGKSAFHHVAFEVSDIHEVFGGGLAFDRKGWPTEVGPGRHPISSAYFWYFKNPCGGAIEYFSDPDYVTEAWKPTAYRVNRFSEWHVVDGVGPADDGRVRPSMAASRAESL
jgi:catechol 2,3-dioxygenase-like lactoylglutathione lyase family enzyme